MPSRFSCTLQSNPCFAPLDSGSVTSSQHVYSNVAMGPANFQEKASPHTLPKPGFWVVLAIPCTFRTSACLLPPACTAMAFSGSLQRCSGTTGTSYTSSVVPHRPFRRCTLRCRAQGSEQQVRLQLGNASPAGDRMLMCLLGTGPCCTCMGQCVAAWSFGIDPARNLQTS